MTWWGLRTFSYPRYITFHRSLRTFSIVNERLINTGIKGASARGCVSAEGNYVFSIVDVTFIKTQRKQLLETLNMRGGLILEMVGSTVHSHSVTSRYLWISDNFVFIII